MGRDSHRLAQGKGKTVRVHLMIARIEKFTAVNYSLKELGMEDEWILK